MVTNSSWWTSAAVSEYGSLLPREVSVGIVESELAAVGQSIKRWGWTMSIDVEHLIFRFRAPHPKDSGHANLVADLTGYRAVPPAWQFVDEAGNGARHAFPAPGPSGSVFHQNAVICAPWNRLAYSELGGPHGDWSGATAWLSVQGNTRATTIADMLAIIRVNLAVSPGWMH